MSSTFKQLQLLAVSIQAIFKANLQLSTVGSSMRNTVSLFFNHYLVLCGVFKYCCNRNDNSPMGKLDLFIVIPNVTVL